jgi:hypothetical protein
VYAREASEELRQAMALQNMYRGPLSPEINLYKNMNNKSKNKYCLERLDEKIINLL